MQVEAIIIGDNHYNALGVIRSLGCHNIDIQLILFESEENFVQYSKFVKKYTIIKQETQLLKKTIFNQLNQDKINVIFPLSDFAAIVCDEISKEDCYRNCIIPNANGSCKVYQNKEIINKIAETCNITVPKSDILKLKDNNELKWNIFPAIIKPLLSIEGHKSDIAIVNEANEFKTVIQGFKDKGYAEVQIQEYINGTDECMLEVMGYVGKNGQVNFSKIIKKIREYPIKNGSTSFAEFVDSWNGIDKHSIVQLLAKTNYYGIFDIEFKYANGTTYFIEINFRNGAPSHALSKQGYNIPYRWLCDAASLNINSSVKMDNRFFMVETRDVVNMLKRDVSLKIWIKDFFRAKLLIWDASDLVPTFKMYTSFLKQIIRRVLR